MLNLYSSVVYVWGYNGYCRLGLGNQQDVLIPKPVPQVRPPSSIFRTSCLIFLQFAGPNEAAMGSDIAAGPSNSVVIDKQGMFWMAGKVSRLLVNDLGSTLTDATQWKNTGDGSSGQPYSSFRYMQDIACVGLARAPSGY